MKVLLVVFVFLKITSIIAQSYNKSELLELYPELGKDFVMIPDDSGEVRVGYLSYPEESNEKNNHSLPRLESRMLGILHHNIEKDITFTLYTRNHPEGNSINEFDHLADYFDETKKTKFIVHGWMGTGTSNVCINIKNGFLNTSDVNVFIVDWSPIAGNRFYPIPMRATSDVGEHYGNFLKYLVDNRGTNPKDIHLIGHSLGAHVSGFAGRGLKNNKVARITGLDPAAPGFDWPLVEGGRLNKNDADFVDVIHTCAGFLGMKDPIGHADFYPNGGGPPQPGCNILEFFEACSHSRSWQLFAESIVLEEPFMATECESLSLLGSSQCKGDEVPMGLQTPLWANGIYYLKTTVQNLATRRRKEFYRSLPPVDFNLADAVKTDVVYKYFACAIHETGKMLTEETVAEENLDGSIPTVLLIHGWTTDDTSPWYELLKDGCLKLGPHNIIYVNWCLAGNKSYDISCANVEPVGRFVAEFLIASKLPQENIHIIGHSLGAHLASFTGRTMFDRTGKKLGRITALDPAGPKFGSPHMDNRHKLCKEDADFVDVIHTDIQLFGYTAPIGHVDFYPNGGVHQPGCPPRNVAENCSHDRSTLYFSESLSRISKARKAVFMQENYEVTVKVSDDVDEVVFGYHVDKSARGIFYLETNHQIPFLK